MVCVNRRDALLEGPDVLFPASEEETPEPPLFPEVLAAARRGRLAVSRAAPERAATAGPAGGGRVQRDARHVGEARRLK